MSANKKPSHWAIMQPVRGRIHLAMAISAVSSLFSVLSLLLLA